MICPHCNRQLVLGLVTWDCSDHGPIQDVESQVMYGWFKTGDGKMEGPPDMVIRLSEPSEGSECCQGGGFNIECGGCPNGPEE